ncbi:methyltransferase [Arthrobacter phage DanielleIgnace]|nr:methyltransferase [Arthrobacter phage DanielleIgnace]
MTLNFGEVEEAPATVQEEPEYGPGYWERGEGSNYHGYGDDPGWEQIVKVLRLHLPEGGTLVEMGCAYGYFVKAARKVGIRCVGVDVSDYALAQAPADVAPYVNKASATDIVHAAPGRLDGIVSWEVLEHLTEDEISETLDGIWKALKPGGLMWHKIALEDSPGVPFHDAHGDDTHVSLFTKDEWRIRLANHGFVQSPGAEDMLNTAFRDRDWYRRFFCYRKPSHEV